MPDDARFAAAARDDGLRRVRRLTFQIGAAALACSAGIMWRTVRALTPAARRCCLSPAPPRVTAHE